MIKTTIIAPATAMVPGAIGIIRLSGEDALPIAKRISDIKQVKTRYAHCVNIGKDALVDKAILIYFQAPYSFTGEDVVEIHVHGNPHLISEVIHLAIDEGAIMAEPGAFSQRAFMNGRLSLDQAEAIADLIHAKSIKAVKSAAQSLDGALLRQVKGLQSRMMALRVLVEASIDFADEDIPSITQQKLASDLKLLQEVCHTLCIQSEQGVSLMKGIQVCLVGRPNAGKSTLMNAVCQQEVSIVTSEAGTTRDAIDKEVIHRGYSLSFCDTAGIRDATSEAEIVGVERARQRLKQADLVLLIQDAAEQQDPIFVDTTAPVWTVQNKVDLLPNTPPASDSFIYLSAKDCKGVDCLLDRIVDHFQHKNHSETPFSARQRHVSVLNRCYATMKDISSHASPEVIAHGLFDAQLILSEMTGEVTCDDLLAKIFSEFCIGK